MQKRQRTIEQLFANALVEHLNSSQNSETKTEKFYECLINSEFTLNDDRSHMQAVLTKVKLQLAVKKFTNELNKII